MALSRSAVPMPDTVEVPDFEPDEVPGCAALAVVFSVAFVPHPLLGWVFWAFWVF